jgi:hypothetical protein
MSEPLITPYDIPEEYERLPPTEGKTEEVIDLIDEVDEGAIKFYEDTLAEIDLLLETYRTGGA